MAKARGAPAKAGAAKKRRGGPAGAGAKRKSCKYKMHEIDYKNVTVLRYFVSEKGKIRSRRITGTSRRMQREVAVAVKRAREMALLPYVAGQ